MCTVLIYTLSYVRDTGKGTYVGGMSKLRFCGFHVLWDAIHYLHKYDSEIYSIEH